MKFSDIAKMATKKGAEIITSQVENLDINNLIQEALNRVLPLKVDIQNSISEKSVVISEESLNTYLNEKIVNIKDLNNLSLKISDDNTIIINGEATKYLIKVLFAQKLKLKTFKINKEEAFAEFLLLGEPEIKAQGIINQIILYITRFILNSLINKELTNLLNENNIAINKDKLFVDLKEKFIKNLYEKDINILINKNIPIIGNKKVIDLISVKNIRTKDKSIMVDLSVLNV